MLTSAIRGRLKHGDTETTCNVCGERITIPKEELKRAVEERRERLISERICTRCGSNPAAEGHNLCDRCLEYSLSVERQKKYESEKDEIKKIVGWSTKKKPKESVDDIARKARSHGLSYGKYLEARARGEYLSEVDE